MINFNFMSGSRDSSKNKKLLELQEELRRHDELYYKQATHREFRIKYNRLKKNFDNLRIQLDPLGLFAEEEIIKNLRIVALLCRWVMTGWRNLSHIHMPKLCSVSTILTINLSFSISTSG